MPETADIFGEISDQVRKDHQCFQPIKPPHTALCLAQLGICNAHRLVLPLALMGCLAAAGFLSGMIKDRMTNPRYAESGFVQAFSDSMSDVYHHSPVIQRKVKRLSALFGSQEDETVEQVPDPLRAPQERSSPHPEVVVRKLPTLVSSNQIAPRIRSEADWFNFHGYTHPGIKMTLDASGIIWIADRGEYIDIGKTSEGEPVLSLQELKDLLQSVNDLVGDSQKTSQFVGEALRIHIENVDRCRERRCRSLILAVPAPPNEQGHHQFLVANPKTAKISLVY